MKSAFMMIFGVLIALFGLGSLIKILVSPLTIKMHSIIGQEVLEETDQIKRNRKKDRDLLMSISIAMIFIGGLLFLIGIYFGYADRGDGFWFHKLFYDSDEAVLCMDNISDDGRYIAKNGKEYSFYIIVQGDKYEFCSEPCDNFDDLKEKLSHIRLGETFLLVDNYAVAAEYNAAIKLLSENGNKIEMEEK